MQVRKIWLSKEVFIGLAVMLVLAAPVFVFGGSKTIYVDQDAKGSEEGSKNHPYHSIAQALKNAKQGTEVHVQNGTYKENITIPKGVEVVGDSQNREKVTIESDNDDKPTVTMKHGTKLGHVTVKGGRHGVRVLEDSKVHIFDVIVKKSDRDGIHIDAAPRNKKYQALIDDAKITDNDRAGIFSEKRTIILINSDIVSNGSDGIDLAAGTRAWFEGNRFNENKGSGAKLILDGADIWSKSNSFRNNKREGVEISSYGAAGNIGFKKAAFVGNDHYGVARIARTSSGLKAFGNVSFGTGVNANRLENGALGNISPVVRGF
jgi:hypothetical protein